MWQFAGSPIPSHRHDSHLLIVFGPCFEAIFDEALTAASDSHRCAWIRRKRLDAIPDPKKLKNPLKKTWLRKIRFCSESDDLYDALHEMTNKYLKPHTIIVEMELPHRESMAAQFAYLSSLARYVVDSRQREKQGSATFPVIAYVPEPTAEALRIATLFSSYVLKVTPTGEFENICHIKGVL